MPAAPKRRWLRFSLRMVRIAASAGCLVACIAFVALWARSFYWNDTVYRHQPGGYWHLRSWKARIEVLKVRYAESPTRHFGVSSVSADEWKALNDRWGGEKEAGPEAFGFGWGARLPDTSRVAAPHWFFALLAGIFAIWLKPKPRWKFSLRELIAIMTMAALVGGAVSSLHSWVFVQPPG